jgi:hypothetical protein
MKQQFVSSRKMKVKVSESDKVSAPSSANFPYASRQDPFLEKMKIKSTSCVWLEDGAGGCHGTIQVGVQRHAEEGEASEVHLFFH